MHAVVIFVLKSIAAVFRSRVTLQIEIFALRHQLAVSQRAARRPRLRPVDRLLWAWLSRAWAGWREALVIVQPRTVIAWQRKRFRDHWTRLSRRGRIRASTRWEGDAGPDPQDISAANLTWAPRASVGFTTATSGQRPPQQGR